MVTSSRAHDLLPEDFREYLAMLARVHLTPLIRSKFDAQRVLEMAEERITDEQDKNRES